MNRFLYSKYTAKDKKITAGFLVPPFFSTKDRNGKRSMRRFPVASRIVFNSSRGGKSKHAKAGSTDDNTPAYVETTYHQFLRSFQLRLRS